MESIIKLTWLQLGRSIIKQCQLHCSFSNKKMNGHADRSRQLKIKSVWSDWCAHLWKAFASCSEFTTQ